jgi:putative copper export protein
MTWSGLTYLLPFALFAGLWFYLRFVTTRSSAASEQQSPVSTPRLRVVPVTITVVVLTLLGIGVAYVADPELGRALLVYIVPFMVFFGVWIALLQRSTRSRTAPASEDVAPTAPQRSRRAALVPVAVVLGISIIARALINN